MENGINKGSTDSVGIALLTHSSTNGSTFQENSAVKSVILDLPVQSILHTSLSRLMHSSTLRPAWQLCLASRPTKVTLPGTCEMKWQCTYTSQCFCFHLLLLLYYRGLYLCTPFCYVGKKKTHLCTFTLAELLSKFSRKLTEIGHARFTEPPGDVIELDDARGGSH